MGLNYPNGDPNMSSTPVGGNVKPVQAMDQMATSSAKIAQGMLNMESSLQRSLKYMQELGKEFSKANSGESNPSPLLNDSTNAGTNNVLSRLKSGYASVVNKMYGIDVNSQSQQLIDKMKRQLDQDMPVPKSMGSRIGGGVAAAAGIAYGMMPNTTDAVAQRMLTQNVASMTGMSNSEITTMSNRMLAGGITGAYSAQASTSILASQGILPTMGSFKNIMGSTGGLSVLTGMSNEQTAQAFGGINSMNFLRVGVRARDSKGQLRAPEEIANDLYRRTFGNRKLTEAQAAQVFNQNSRSYQGIMAVAGGDAELAAQLQEMMFYQGKGGGKKLNVKDAQNVKDNILKLDKDDPSRAQWNYQGSQANVLEKTGKGLVEGYSGALNATASVNNGMASLAGLLPQVTQAFGNLKGFLDTLPTAGNTGAMLTGGLSAGAGNLGAIYAMRKMSMGLTATEAALGGGAASGGGVAAAGGTAALATKLSGGGAVSRVLGRGLESFGAKGGMTLARGGGAALLGGATYYGLSKAQNRLQQYGRDHNFTEKQNAWGNELFNMGKYAATGAAAGMVLGGPIGAAAGAVAGTAFGVGHSIYDFATGNWGRGALGNGASGDHNTAKRVKSDLPRNAREAASWAIQQAKSGASGWHNYCEKFVESAWGKPGRYASAISHWGVAVREKRAYKGSKDAPPGAFVFWGGGQYGHTAISIGGGKVVSTDILRRGKADIVNIDTITKRWNKPYLGWADPSKNTRLRKGATPIDSDSPTSGNEVTPTSKKSSQTPTSTESNMPWYQKALNSISSVFSSVSASSNSQSAGSSLAVASEAIGMAEVASTASLLGFGSSSSPGYSGSDININMTVNIGSTSKIDIQSLARDIKTAIDKEMRNEKIRGF